MGERDVMRAAEGFLEGVKRTGADVAEDDADGTHSQTRHSATIVHVCGMIAACTICCHGSSGRGSDFLVH